MEQGVGECLLVNTGLPTQDSICAPEIGGGDFSSVSEGVKLCLALNEAILSLLNTDSLTL